MREKKCKGCDQKFRPERPMQSCCRPRCAIEYARVLSEKKVRRERRESKLRLKTRSKWIQEAQTAFNAYIRERDRMDSCICCGQWPGNRPGHWRGGDWDAGHYRSVGAAPHLRFNEDNCHKQRKHCNRDRSGNAVDYRIRLIRKIGLLRVEALESDQSVVKWTIPEIRAIRNRYRMKLKELKALRESVTNLETV